MSPANHPKDITTSWVVEISLESCFYDLSKQNGYSERNLPPSCQARIRMGLVAFVWLVSCVQQPERDTLFTLSLKLMLW
jgi:hypothetical protein